MSLSLGRGQLFGLCCLVASLSLLFLATNTPRTSSFALPQLPRSQSHLLLHNDCKLPILEPHDCSIAAFDKPVDNLEDLCAANQSQPFAYQDESGFLIVRDLKTMWCSYIGITGAIKPSNKIQFIGLWTHVRQLKTWVQHEQYLVNCQASSVNNQIVFSEAFFHVPPSVVENFESSSERKLSIDLLVLESVSLNQFKRFMPKSWPLLTQYFGFHVFEGYNKVADNTLVNTHPILTGELYRGAVTSVFEGMSAAERKRKGRYPIEESHFFWKRMNGAASLWVSDPRWDMYFYPARVAGGPCRPITHFYLRPYMHQWLTLRNYSMTRCVSYHNARQTLNLTRLWLQRFKDTYHFTFSKIMMLLHHHTGNGGTLSSLDEPLAEWLSDLASSGVLEKTVLVLVGDHGHRVESIAKTFVGRLEERLPFLALRFPMWFQEANPELMQKLTVNQQRLVSNFDLYQTLRDVAQGQFGDARRRISNDKTLGTSLFSEIPRNRSCAEATIAREYCTCLEAQAAPSSDVVEEGLEVVRGFLGRLSVCAGKLSSPKLLDYAYLSSSQHVRQSIVKAASQSKLKKPVFLETRYLELRLSLGKGLSALFRLTHRLSPPRRSTTPSPTCRGLSLNSHLLLTLPKASSCRSHNRSFTLPSYCPACS